MISLAPEARRDDVDLAAQMGVAYATDVRTRAALATLAACATVASSSRASTSDRPALVVLIVVDQMGSEYMARWGRHLNGGIAKLARRGAYYPRVVHAHANAATAPGHATIVTGAWPNVHGIISNRWCSPTDGSKVYCVADPTHGASPKRLMAPTLADALRRSTQGKGRTISVALKDRVAVLTAGQRPDAAVWYDNRTGGFVTGKWHGPAKTPAWVTQTSAAHNARVAFGKTWTRLRTDLDYRAVVGADDHVAEAKMPGLGRVFPRTYGQGLEGPMVGPWAGMFPGTPAGLDAVVAMAQAAFDHEKLGQDDTTDLLFVGLTTLDLAGHWWGPGSQEAFDVFLRTDKAIGDLMRHIERKLGGGRTLWVVTADHGVALAPERATELGVRAHRYKGSELVAVIDKTLAPLARSGKPACKTLLVDPPFIYLGHEDPGADRTRLRRAVAAALRDHPAIVEAHAIDDFDNMRAPFKKMYARLLFPGRTADILVRGHPNDLIEPDGYQTGSGHGSPYNYDTHVPVLIGGPGVRSGRDPRPYEMTRLAPTIATLAGFTIPAAAFEPPLPAALP